MDKLGPVPGTSSNTRVYTIIIFFNYHIPFFFKGANIFISRELLQLKDNCASGSLLPAWESGPFLLPAPPPRASSFQPFAADTYQADCIFSRGCAFILLT